MDILKPRGAVEVFTTLSRYPKRRFSINELAKLSEVPFATAWGIVQKFDKAGIVDTERIGKSVAVILRQSELTGTFRRLLSLHVSPHHLALQKLKSRLKKMGVKRAYLFGSVAEGKETLGSDIDVAVLSNLTSELDGVSEAVYSSHKMKVVFINFRAEKELLKFIEGKPARRLL